MATSAVILKVVDGVVSEDSDSLLYGAETIYRQLSVNKVH